MQVQTEALQAILAIHLDNCTLQLWTSHLLHIALGFWAHVLGTVVLQLLQKWAGILCFQ